VTRRGEKTRATLVLMFQTKPERKIRERTMKQGERLEEEKVVLRGSRGSRNRTVVS